MSESLNQENEREKIGVTRKNVRYIIRESRKGRGIHRRGCGYMNGDVERDVHRRYRCGEGGRAWRVIHA